MSVAVQIAQGLQVQGMLPLDSKLQKLTLAQLQDLGPANVNAFNYYEWMTILVVEDGSRWTWQEVSVGNTDGALPQNFQYPANTIANGIDYSNRYFNFIKQETVVTALGQPFVVMKKTSVNGNPWLETDDVVFGFINATTLILARYKGGAVNALSSFAIMDSWNPDNFN